MKIYKLKEKDCKKELTNMMHTYYGKIVFTLSYSISFLSLLAMIIFYVTSLNETYFISFYLILIPFTFISFVLGSINFYNNFKEFLEGEK